MGLKYRQHSKFTIEHIQEVLCDDLKSKRIFTLDSYGVCVSTPILKLEMIIYVIHHNYSPDETIPYPIQRSKLFLPTTRTQTSLKRTDKNDLTLQCKLCSTQI